MFEEAGVAVDVSEERVDVHEENASLRKAEKRGSLISRWYGLVRQRRKTVLRLTVSTEHTELTLNRRAYQCQPRLFRESRLDRSLVHLASAKKHITRLRKLTQR